MMETMNATEQTEHNLNAIVSFLDRGKLVAYRRVTAAAQDRRYVVAYNASGRTWTAVANLDNPDELERISRVEPRRLGGTAATALDVTAVADAIDVAVSRVREEER